VPSVNLRPTLQPFAIPRCSSLQIPKNAPCSLSRENSLQHLGTITKFHRQRMGLSLHFVQISLQIANCRENGRRDRFASDCILSHAVWSPPSPCTGRAASHVPAPWLPGRRERRVEARAGALHNEHVDAVVSSIDAPPQRAFLTGSRPPQSPRQ
jgi:hypothetical protein